MRARGRGLPFEDRNAPPLTPNSTLPSLWRPQSLRGNPRNVVDGELIVRPTGLARQNELTTQRSGFPSRNFAQTALNRIRDRITGAWVTGTNAPGRARGGGGAPPNPVNPQSGLTPGMAAFTRALGSAVVPLTAAAIAAGAVAVAMRSLYNRANEQAARLGAYSGELASAQARSQVASIRQDIRSSQYLGRDLARLVDVQTRTGVVTSRILDVIEKRLLESILPWMESIASFMEWAEQYKLGEAAGAAAGGAVVSGLTAMGFGNLATMLFAMTKYLQSMSKDGVIKEADFVSLFFDLKDLDIDSNEGEVGNPKGKRREFGAVAFGDQPMP